MSHMPMHSSVSFFLFFFLLIPMPSGLGSFCFESFSFHSGIWLVAAVHGMCPAPALRVSFSSL